MVSLFIVPNTLYIIINSLIVLLEYFIEGHYVHLASPQEMCFHTIFWYFICI